MKIKCFDSSDNNFNLCILYYLINNSVYNNTKLDIISIKKLNYFKLNCFSNL